MTDNRIFISTPIREHDSNGKLIRSGLEWNERTHIHTNLRVFVWLAYIIGGVVVALGFMASPSLKYGPEPLYAILIGAGIMLFGLMLQKMKPPIRSVIFTANNETLTPQGIPGHREIKQLTDCPPSSIESIGTSEDPRLGHIAQAGGAAGSSMAMAASVLTSNSGVRMITSEGEVEYLAEGVHKDSAFKIGRQLTIALGELRDANPNTRHRL